ncbi:tetratricopeptide repeat protein [Rhizobium tumorigenes]|uniref:Ancillary SecYEG translocon subunit n=1 Tax=Rhizobium tumorigenes TaxID=2041385 RepID=A0AAF1K2M0_9HYPH|nr:tetratricopeptide repeat protein [Rhizobium tumorigenes]WFR94261.1 tetratricopeptide repeat protein [Rhizobium tumorigenes]
MAFNDDSFIREVNEELRSDRMQFVWRRFGRLIIGFAVLVVIGTAGYVGYRYWATHQAGDNGDKFLAALALADQNKTDDALAALAAIEKDGKGAYPLLASMRAASLQAQKGDTSGAVAAFTAISKQSGVPSVIADAARLRAAFLLVDTGTYQQVSALAEEMAVPASAFRHSAREVLGLSAYKAGDFAKARQWFQAIVSDQQSPRNIANRAQMMLDNIEASGKAPQTQG